MIDIVKIIQETATWIEKVNNDYEFNLYRTLEFIPAQRYPNIPDDKKTEVVSHIISTRSTLLNDPDISLIPVDELHNYGRIMMFDVNDTVCDGAPEANSAFYLDIDDAPPYDTWLAMGTQLNEIDFYDESNPIKDVVIVAWVPKSQYFYANVGVEVACVDNLWWASSEHINKEFSAIKSLFKKPENIIDPLLPIDVEKRMKLLNDIQRHFDKDFKPYYLKSPKPSKPKTFLQKLFGK